MSQPHHSFCMVLGMYEGYGLQPPGVTMSEKFERSDETDRFLLVCGMLTGMLERHQILDYLTSMGVTEAQLEPVKLFLKDLYSKTLEKGCEDVPHECRVT